MPTTKRRLTRTEQANYLSCLQELQRGGCDVEIPSAWVNESRGLDIVVAGPPASTIYETPTGSAYYAIWVRMVSHHGRVDLLDCEGETEWDDCIGLLPFDPSHSQCWAGDTWYPAKQTLNGRIENYLRFHHRGQFIEGLILFSGLARIPEHYRDGGHTPSKLTFHDQFGQRISAEAELLFQRAKRVTRKISGPPVRSSLYEPSENSPSESDMTGRPACQTGILSHSCPADARLQECFARGQGRVISLGRALGKRSSVRFFLFFARVVLSRTSFRSLPSVHDPYVALPKRTYRS
jgi:hypothetical protein